MGTVPTGLKDYNAISDTVQHYIDGSKTGSVDELKRAFHQDATIFGHSSDKLLAGHIQQFYDRVEKNPAGSDLQAKIASIDVADTVATVRLELDNWAGKRYTDLYTLLKADGEWKIINKVFHLHS